MSWPPRPIVLRLTLYAFMVGLVASAAAGWGDGPHPASSPGQQTTASDNPPAKAAETVTQTPPQQALSSGAPPNREAASNNDQPTGKRSLRVRAFQHELRAFATDLQYFAAQRRGVTLSNQRARKLAWLAVSDAYRYQIPPAMIFGVMLVENPWFQGWRTSSAGAVGLMQIMPNVWLGECGERFGQDLRSDKPNMQCGNMVLAHYANMSGGWWKETLWRYNGWGRTYPQRVRKRVETYARNLCPSHSFEHCVSQPLYISYRPAGAEVAQGKHQDSTG